MAFWPFGYTEATDVDEDNDFSGGGGLLRTGKRQRKWKFKTIREWLESTAEFLSLIAYRDRVKTKVLYTGPLSAVGVSTPLDGAEKFSDWDLIMIDTSLLSDVELFSPTSMTILKDRSIAQFFSDTGRFKYQKLTDTTFQIAVKTVGAGNIQRIVGISL